MNEEIFREQGKCQEFFITLPNMIRQSVALKNSPSHYAAVDSDSLIEKSEF